MFVLLFSIGLSAQTNKRVIELSGTIANKYPITMTLAIKSDTVIGYYYYERFKTKILLVGFAKGSNIVLSEGSSMATYSDDIKKLSANNEPEVGFVGELKDGAFVGKWKQAAKRLDFKTQVGTDNNVTTNMQQADIEGNYTGLNNEEQYNHLMLRHINQNVFYFYVSVNFFNSAGGMGELAGIVDLKNLKSGSFTDAECKSLDFNVINNHEVKVTETECSFYHGARCYFNDNYKKATAKTQKH